ncbi:MAG TPA: class I SAM-dependent methyltransferase, partial [archaeon]|nr:class I SAM-dependent methyltransferase [archaeon]
MTFVGRCGARLAEVLRGTCDPLELLFPGGSLTDLEAFYARSPFLKPYNTVLQKAIAIALERVPKGRMVRIVELGAGTGGMTSAVLPVLTADRTDYVFTDISALFTSRAQHKFRQFPFVRYALLDIEQDPRRQGFAPHSFDVVLAANVLHATSDLRRTLAHVQQLLAPDGLLALFDATKPFRWADLIFGMMEGWWKFTDTALRPAHALLTQGAWCTLLAEMGFTDVVGIADPAPGEEDPWQAIVLARGARIEQPAQPAVTAAPAPESSGSWLVFADRRGVGRTLAERLTARGDRCVVVEWADQRERVDDDHVRIRLGQPEDLHQLV